MRRLAIILLTLVIIFILTGCNHNIVDTNSNELVEDSIEEDTPSPTEKATNTPATESEENHTPTPTLNEHEYITPLTDEEFSFNGLRTHMCPEEVKAALGEPIEEEIKYDELLGFDLIYYTYTDYYMQFALDMYQTGADYDDAIYIATVILVKTENISCLRGVKIGDTLDEVLVKIGCDMLPPPNMNEEDLGNYDVEYFYGKNTSWQDSKAATVVYDGDTLIRFVFGHHIAGVKRTIVFEFTDDIVTDIEYSEEIGFC